MKGGDNSKHNHKRRIKYDGACGACGKIADYNGGT